MQRLCKESNHDLLGRHIAPHARGGLRWLERRTARLVDSSTKLQLQPGLHPSCIASLYSTRYHTCLWVGIHFQHWHSKQDLVVFWQAWSVFNNFLYEIVVFPANICAILIGAENHSAVTRAIVNDISKFFDFLGCHVCIRTGSARFLRTHLHEKFRL